MAPPAHPISDVETDIQKGAETFPGLAREAASLSAKFLASICAPCTTFYTMFLKHMVRISEMIPKMRLILA